MRIQRLDMRRKTRVCVRLKISRYAKSCTLTFRSICVTIFVRLDKRNDEESTQKEVLQRSPIRLRGMDGRLRKMASEWCG